MTSKDKEYAKGLMKINEIIEFIKEKKASNNIMDKKYAEGKQLLKNLKKLLEEDKFKQEII